MEMILELPIATAMVLLTVVVHGGGLMAVARLLEATARNAAPRPVSWQSAFTTIAMVLGLFVLHGFEIWLYAMLFVKLGAVPDVREAVYFSTIAYGAIGFGDGTIAGEWKLLGAIEGINGAILLGWSVAFFVNVMAPMLPPPRRRRWR